MALVQNCLTLNAFVRLYIAAKPSEGKARSHFESLIHDIVTDEHMSIPEREENLRRLLVCEVERDIRTAHVEQKGCDRVDHSSQCHWYDKTCISGGRLSVGRDVFTVLMGYVVLHLEFPNGRWNDVRVPMTLSLD